MASRNSLYGGPVEASFFNCFDGTAKGGVALVVVKQMDLAHPLIGAGEGIEDLRPFFPLAMNSSKLPLSSD